MTEFALSLGMIAAFLLIGGGIFLIRTRKDRKRGILMLVAAVVIIGNVVLLTGVPSAG